MQAKDESDESEAELSSEDESEAELSPSESEGEFTDSSEESPKKSGKKGKKSKAAKSPKKEARVSCRSIAVTDDLPTRSKRAAATKKPVKEETDCDEESEEDEKVRCL